MLSDFDYLDIVELNTSHEIFVGVDKPPLILHAGDVGKIVECNVDTFIVEMNTGGRYWFMKNELRRVRSYV